MVFRSKFWFWNGQTKSETTHLKKFMWKAFKGFCEVLSSFWYLYVTPPKKNGSAMFGCLCYTCIADWFSKLPFMTFFLWTCLSWFILYYGEAYTHPYFICVPDCVLDSSFSTLTPWDLHLNFFFAMIKSGLTQVNNNAREAFESFC